MPLKARDINRLAGELKEYYTLLNSSGIDSRIAKQALQRLRSSGRPGNRLAALGIGLILVPEPIVSDVVGVSLLVLGKLIDKVYASKGVKDVREAALDALDYLSSKSEI